MFEKAQKTIIDMSNELPGMEDRYGKESPLVKKLTERVIVLSGFHDYCLRIIQQQHHELKLFRANYTASQMIRAKRQGKSYHQMAIEGGPNDPEKWKVLDEVDELIKEVRGG